MKSKGLIIITILFFLVVNSSHFWEGKMSILYIPVFIFLSVVFLILSIICLSLIVKGCKGKFSDQHRNRTIIIMIISLGLVCIKPDGIINFDKLEGEDLLIAQREGAANCMTTFKLKPNNKFKERSMCFGISEVKGKYEIRNDTIFFVDVNLPIDYMEYYEFGMFKKSKYRNEKALFRYRNKSDTIGNELWITKNNILN